jgi:hypothetical protein
MIATGPLVAKRNATTALAAYVPPKSATHWTRARPTFVSGKTGFSSGICPAVRG